MAVKDELGRRGEELAAEFLEGTGLTVVARNWRCRDGEVDIIATDRANLMVICEVKTRSQQRFGAGAEAVDIAKRRRIRRVSTVYLAQRRVRVHVAVRFDVISVYCPPGVQPQITHYPAAF